MRLSKLHIAGFKSFPDRAELGFDYGVTAIVGPNGCGKSNVVDAITWVLGEQSARSLRGERMEDVIFNGSDARKPTATAEVRLKLTEVAQAAMAAATAAAQEPDELLDGAPLVMRDVEIGRRLYRSGESEYLIDGEVCRLRDVHDLLMDSGLGVKAYAVIEQGKIGQILSSRPAERRMLIEEAAGVTKYKSRRRMAELKLEAAQGNLTRIDDIIFEVEKQRAALKRQAARARRYKRLREELRTWEQVQFAHRHETLSREIEAADERLAGARAREAAAAAHVAELEAELSAVRLGLTEAEAAATAAREAAHARELEIGRAQQQVQFDRQQIEDLAAQAARFDAEASELEGRRGPSADALAAQRDAAARAGQAQADIAARVLSRTRDYEAAQAAVQAVEQESDAARATVLSSATTLSALEQARENAAAVRDRVAAERERLDLEARDLETEALRARRDREAADAALADVRARGEAAALRQASAEKALAAARERREQLATAVGARERELAGREARLRSLQELDASRATFGDAARLLLGETGATLRRHGAVADHLRVDRSYERAVDALLGDLLQHVLVDEASDAEAGLALLTERGAGRGGFLVLAAASGLAGGPLIVPPGARALADVVHPSGPHASAIARLVGHALIVDSFATARQLARTVDVPVAALTGEVCRGAWLVQGGSRQDVRGILETRAEVATLTEEVRTMAAEVAALIADRDATEQAIATSESAAASARGERHECEKAVVGLEAEAARAASELDRVTRRLEVVSTERGRAEEEHASAEGRRAEAAAAIVTHETHQRDAETGLGGVLLRLQAAREDAEARLRLVTESRAEQAALAERVSGLEADVARLEEAARDLDARIENRRADIRRTEERREALRASIIETERRLDEDIRSVDALKHDMRGADGRVGELREAFNTADHAIRGARHAQDGVRSQVLELELARARAAGDLAHLGEACLEATGTSIEEVVTTVAALEDQGALVAPQVRTAAADDDEEVAEEGVAAAEAAPEPAVPPSTPDAIIAMLRGKIDRLGPVNMMAIEQFDELESRHTFLTTQRKDLLDSIAQTGDAIRKIDKTTRERFAEAFESINVHFERTFTTLFGGGRAGLVLIDQENETESGIDIIAQPPGKRLQNVQLLSGGEKALTAMALMFAIFKHRPSPFCLLDEIDAPLDDANIGRFIEMLQGMQDHTQFILITHNRKTMEIANRLYGVTMEEPGVSKLISLQLN